MSRNRTTRHQPCAHTPIIRDRALFNRVQPRTVSRGRQPKSQRLLARLGVLRCATCGSLMAINSHSGNYRCGNTSAHGCDRRAAVKADRVEQVVMDHVRAWTADARGRASSETHRREAQAAPARAKEDLRAAFRTLAGYEHEESTRTGQCLSDASDRSQTRGSNAQRPKIRPSRPWPAAREWPISGNGRSRAQPARIARQVRRSERAPNARPGHDGCPHLAVAFLPHPAARRRRLRPPQQSPLPRRRGSRRSPPTRSRRSSGGVSCPDGHVEGCGDSVLR